MTQPVREPPSFFENFDAAAAQDLKSLQLAPGQPEIEQGIFEVSDPIVPDRITGDRLAHFDPELYDLRDSSHLIKLLSAFLGGAGAGGLRKQLAVVRMQNAFNGMHFLDLDRFYGALFGIKRTEAELVPGFAFNPYTDPATADGWDDIHSRDASYRDRLIKFTRAIPYGASYLGLKTMAEALISDECDLYEAWSWIDEQNAGQHQATVLQYSYGFLADEIGTYGALEEKTWGDWSGAGSIFVGRLSTQLRSEWVLQPKRDLSEDERYQLVRVLNTFKPAGTQFTIAETGLNVHVPHEIRDVAANSEHWEIISSVIPSSLLNWNPYTTDFWGAVPAQGLPQVRPAFSGYQGEEWSLNGEVVSATSYTLDETGNSYSGNDQLVTYADGTTHRYEAGDGLLGTAQATAARLISDGVLTSAPYAPGRSSVSLSTISAGVNP